ncbi:hypothetical protein HAX54_006516, partial [Datura stramonium]|nr:hypothetical protein [Datura stramonium]
VTGEVTARHNADNGFDGLQLDNRPSLGSLRSSLISLRVTELATDRQASDVPSWRPSHRSRITGPLLKADGEGDSPLGE